MFRRTHTLLVFTLLISVGTTRSAALQDEVASALARAEALYYEARFDDAIEVLTRLDAMLDGVDDRIPERVSVKLQLALAHIGLNQTDQARAHFVALRGLDSAYTLDPQLYAPKVLVLFDEAKAEFDRMRCTTLRASAASELDRGAANIFLEEFGSPEACSCLQSMIQDAAELVYQQGLDAYRGDDLQTALERLRSVLELRPDHELAAQYLELTENKMRLEVDRLLLEWRQAFDERNFAEATIKYRELVAADVGNRAPAARNQIHEDYRTAIAPIVESWKAACAGADFAGVERLRQQAMDMLPDPAIAESLLAEIRTCNVLPCIEMASALALTRVRTRVDFELPTLARNFGTINITASVKIDEEGNVTVTSMSEGNSVVTESIKGALEQWKFYPAIVQDKVRCVETDLPIVVNP